ARWCRCWRPRRARSATIRTTRSSACARWRTTSTPERTTASGCSWRARSTPRDIGSTGIRWRRTGASPRRWGSTSAERRYVADCPVVAIHPYRHDPDPSPLLGNIVDGLRHRARITQPMVRAGWLDRGPGPDARRGAEPFVPLEWPRATDLLARELRRVYDRHGGSAVYGGSYGWSSAGRFHHAQSQLHRFLNCLGG